MVLINSLAYSLQIAILVRAKIREKNAYFCKSHIAYTRPGTGILLVIIIILITLYSILIIGILICFVFPGFNIHFRFCFFSVWLSFAFSLLLFFLF